LNQQRESCSDEKSGIDRLAQTSIAKDETKKSIWARRSILAASGRRSDAGRGSNDWLCVHFFRKSSIGCTPGRKADCLGGNGNVDEHELSWLDELLLAEQ
jgi:hypothetical protein